MSLSVFETQGILFPNEEPVEEYVRELSRSALRKLEDMSYPQEKKAMERYMNMYNKFYGASSTNRQPLSATRFASPENVRSFQQEYANADGADDTDGKTIKYETAESMLHFLFVYYFSYHEAEEAQRKRIRLLSFTNWFSRLRTKLGRQMRREMEKKEAAYNALNGTQRQDYIRRLKSGVKEWKTRWRAYANATIVEQFNQAADIVTTPDFDSVDWWLAFKIDPARIQTTGASAVKADALKHFRRWSRFFHPDNNNNKRLGSPFRHRLSSRFIGLTNKRDEMLAWYDHLAIVV